MLLLVSWPRTRGPTRLLATLTLSSQWITVLLDCTVEELLGVGGVIILAQWFTLMQAEP